MSELAQQQQELLLTLARPLSLEPCQRLMPLQPAQVSLIWFPLVYLLLNCCLKVLLYLT
jgi:hypothetical protein